MKKLSFKNLLSVDQFTIRDIDLIFKRSKKMRQLYQSGKGDLRLKDKILAALFYEPSSRTFTSFASAMQRLGGSVVAYQGMDKSSAAKGETLEDTITTFSQLVDILVIRHPEKGSAQRASLASSIPIINAGDGVGEHPTQALLDAFTIINHFPKLDKITVGIVGDLKNGRTTHSLVKLLVKLGIQKFIWISPVALRMPKEIYQNVNNKDIEIIESENLTDYVPILDILYITRVQKERFSSLAEYKKYKSKYIIDAKLMKMVKRKMILMHPLPRIDEIAKEVDSDSRALYFREQIQNGLFVRMALLDLMLRN